MKEMKKEVAMATAFVTIGSVIFLAAIAGIVYMYLSTFLPGMWFTRKVIYAVLFYITYTSNKAVEAGKKYLKAYRKLTKGGRR